MKLLSIVQFHRILCFWLVIGQISVYVWSLSRLDRETARERESSQKPKRFLVVFKGIKMVINKTDP